MTKVSVVRSRARVCVCVCRWSQEVQARTKIDPKNGGGYTQEYTWEQTPTEVSIMFEVRTHTHTVTQSHYTFTYIKVLMPVQPSGALQACVCG